MGGLSKNEKTAHARRPRPDSDLRQRGVGFRISVRFGLVERHRPGLPHQDVGPGVENDEGEADDDHPGGRIQLRSEHGEQLD